VFSCTTSRRIESSSSSASCNIVFDFSGYYSIGLPPKQSTTSQPGHQHQNPAYRTRKMDILGMGTASLDLLFMTPEERTAHDVNRMLKKLINYILDHLDDKQSPPSMQDLRTSHLLAVFRQATERHTGNGAKKEKKD
jgi:hypothetical protein